MHPATSDGPVLSICVPTYNRARYLACLLEDLASRIGELGCSYEVLIGDNASEDDTGEVAASYQDRLNIRYFRRPRNVGAYRNLSKLFGDAQGRYTVYLADDDLLIPDALGRLIANLEEYPDVGAAFAPWITHDRVAGVDFGKFYELEQVTRIEATDYGSLFTLLVNGHIFPEIYVARTSLARAVAGDANAFAFVYFVQIAAMVERTAVVFSPEPFYRQVIRYFPDESRAQAGHEEVKVGWDRYRGGLEYILARIASVLSAEDLDWCRRAIDDFTRLRMQVGLRLRTAAGKDWVDNYYIANRLRSTGDDSLLSADYETYRINAACEYLLTLQPFYPEPAVIAFYEDEPPLTLAQSPDFAAAGLLALTDRSAPLPSNTVLLGSRERLPADSTAFVISEAELLARFP